ncbi:MAG TPA: adenylate/guanylate cyclase domain-containing protein [Chloroflexia bacterium]|nr:adenylate/guanylate cyclase domain-containing protein [Chloroflexia bacterium]
MGDIPELDPQVTEQWRSFLMGETTPFHRVQRVFRHIPASPRCRLCYAPFKGPGGAVMRIVGRAPAKMNPSICDVCERRGREHPGGAVVPLSMLFADIRGSTALAERLGTTEYPRLIARFYDAVTAELLKQNAMIDRLLGDEAVALFVPILTGKKHAEAAVEAARGILKATGHGDGSGPWVPVGIGVHTGTAFVGSLGSAGVSDFTALGDDVNLTARLASVAAAGEIVMTEATRTAAGLPADGLEMRSLELKGRSTPADVWVIRTGVGAAK